jgi:hypothetical protein
MLEVNESGLIYRRVSSQQMIVDCPKGAVERIEETQEGESFRMRSNGKYTIAFRLQNRVQGNAFKDRLKAMGIELVLHSQRNSEQSSGSRFPNLSSKLVQDFILELVFSQEFHLFSEDLEKLINGWVTNLNIH